METLLRVLLKQALSSQTEQSSVICGSPPFSYSLFSCQHVDLGFLL
jgi:hypothetical protein